MRLAGFAFARYYADMTSSHDALAASVYSGNGMGQHYTDSDHVVVRRAVELVQEKGARTVHDIACGRGITSLALCTETEAEIIVATDINEQAVRELAERAQQDELPIDARVESVTDDKRMSLGVYDVVIAKDVFPFLEPQGTTTMLENVADSLKSGGWFLVTAPSTHSQLYRESTPTGHNVFYRKLGEPAKAHIQTDLDYFTFTTVTDLGNQLRANDLEMTEAFHFGRAGGWIMALAQRI